MVNKIIIQCETSNAFDLFYIPDKNTLDELKEYAENNMPIKCFYIYNFEKRYIVEYDTLKEVYLYLNNYLYYKDISEHCTLMKEIEFNNFHNNQCNLCYKDDYNYGLGCSLDIIYDSINGHRCNNFRKKKVLKFIEWIKNIIK